MMSPKTPLLLNCLLLVCLLCLVGCGNPAQDILGKWERGDEILEFVEEGSWYSHSPANVLGTNWGTWQINEEEKLVMRYANPPMPAYEREHNFEVSKKELIIKDYDSLPEKTLAGSQGEKAPSREVVYRFTRMSSAKDKP